MAGVNHFPLETHRETRSVGCWEEQRWEWEGPGLGMGAEPAAPTHGAEHDLGRKHKDVSETHSTQ